jgi:uncharacterized protein (DUF58 family)
MRSWLAAFTTRGSSFLAAGVAAGLAGLLLSERDLVSVGVLLLVLPLFSALAAARARYRLSCARSVTPARVAAGQTARVLLHLDNVSRLPSGLLLAEDAVPYQLGTRPRYVLNGIERGGSRDLSYPVRSDVRGKFVIGPLQIRVADSFGLVELGRSFTSRTTLVVTPRVVPLPRAVVGGSWLGDGDGRSRTVAAAGEDDVVPRAYRDGDELRRVHWRSTARYGELMVRREEQQWRNRVMILLDTRRSAHGGTGATSSFEAAVSAAASIGTHLAREGLDGELITDAGKLAAPGVFEDVLLDSLAVIAQSRGYELDPGITALRGGGLLVAILGRMSVRSARQLAASRRDAGPSMALLLAVSTWARSGQDHGGQDHGGQDHGGQDHGGQDHGGQDHGGQGLAGPDGQAGRAAVAGAMGTDSTAASTPGGSTADGSSANGSSANGSSADRSSADRSSADRSAPGSSSEEGGARERREAADLSETAQAATILRAAGWRVVALGAATPLAVAWQQLSLFPAAASPVPAPPSTPTARGAAG